MRVVGRLLLLSLVLAARGDDETDEDASEENGEEEVPMPEEKNLTAEHVQAVHGKMDANQDGQVSFAEAMSFSNAMHRAATAKDIVAIIAEMDRDFDGKLSLEEALADYTAWDPKEEDERAERDRRMEMERQKFHVADGDGDGKLNKEELRRLVFPEAHDGVIEILVAANLKRKDLDGDGQLTSDEFWKGEASDEERVGNAAREQAIFTHLDKDSDGLLSSEELRSWESRGYHSELSMRSLFDAADEDGDQHLGADELETSRERLEGTEMKHHLMGWAEHLEL